MGSIKICDNCDKPIPSGAKSSAYKSTFDGDVLCDYEDICAACEQRIRALADNQFKTPRKTRKEKPAPATEKK